jgi:hypothetical protein
MDGREELVALQEPFNVFVVDDPIFVHRHKNTFL